jgi:tRNA nucleotidyltransferase (CCA-adding enzyme)
MIRATRYRARLGWEMDPRTQARYDNAKNEGVIERFRRMHAARNWSRLATRKTALKVLRALEAEGWMKSSLSGMDLGQGR